MYNAQDLSAIQDSSLSHVMAGFMLFTVPQPQVALKEALQVLTTEHGGGVLAATTWEGSEWMRLMDAMTMIRPDLKVWELPRAWRSTEGVRGEFQAAGFRDVDVRSMQTYMPFEDHTKQVNIFMSMPLMTGLIEQMTLKEKDRSRVLMVQQMKVMYPQAPSRMAGTAIIGVGRK